MEAASLVGQLQAAVSDAGYQSVLGEVAGHIGSFSENSTNTPTSWPASKG